MFLFHFPVEYHKCDGYLLLVYFGKKKECLYLLYGLSVAHWHGGGDVP